MFTNSKSFLFLKMRFMFQRMTELIEQAAIGAFNSASRSNQAARRGPSVPYGSGFTVVGTSIVEPPEEPHPVVLSVAELRKHSLSVGSSGCGKTENQRHLINTGIAAGRTVFIFDLEGDLTDIVQADMAASGDVPGSNVCLIDLRQKERVVGFNPLAGDGDIHSRAHLVLDVLRRESDSWGVQIEHTLGNCLVALAETGFTLAEVVPLLTDEAFRERVLCRVYDPFAVSFLSEYHGLSKERRRLLTLPVMNKLSPLLSVPRVRRTLGSDDSIDVRKLLDRPGQIVLVALAVDQLHRSARLLGSMLIASIWNALLSRSGTPEANRNPVALHIDEFQNFASSSFESFVAESRRYGGSLHLSHQNQSQLSVGLRHVLRNNISTQFLFQTGAIDAAEVSKEVVGLGSRERVKRLLMTQKVGEALLVRRGRKTVRLRTSLRPKPSVPKSVLREYRQAALRAFSTPCQDVDDDMRSRLCDHGNDSGDLAFRHHRLPDAAGRRAL